MNTNMKRNTILTVLAIVGLGGISQREVRSHSATGNLAAGGSNVTCPALPDGVPTMNGLTTGWAMSTASSAVRILLSDQTLACREPKMNTVPPPGPCTDSWQVSFTLPEELQMPGVYNLAEHKVEFMQAATSGGKDEGCGSQPCVGSSTGSAGGGPGPDAVVEIYAITEACITGRIVRFNNDQSGVDYTGAFQAVRCEPAGN